MSKPKVGFTLVELVACLAILSVFGALVVVKTSSSLSRHQCSEFAERIQKMEFAARQRALERAESIDVRYSNRRRTMHSETDSGVEVTNLVFPRAIHSIAIRTDRVWKNTEAIAISSRGFSRDYALRLKSKGQTVFLFFVGATGQSVVCGAEEDVDELFE